MRKLKIKIVVDDVECNMYPFTFERNGFFFSFFFLVKNVGAHCIQLLSLLSCFSTSLYYHCTSTASIAIYSGVLVW